MKFFSGVAHAWQRLAVRTRLVVIMVLLTLLAVVVSGSVSYALQRGAIQQRVDESLVRTVEEVRILAEEGVDPATGQPFTESDQLVFVAMTRHMPSDHESMLGLNADGVTWTANPAVPLRLENDRELVAQLETFADPEHFSTDVLLRTFTTSVTEYRAVIIPVTYLEDAEPSIMVVAADYRAAMQELDSVFITYALTGLAVIIIVGLIGLITIGRQLAPLRELQSTASSISDAEIDRRVPVTGKDDVAELSRSFNEMLDRLQGAFQSQRQLLDDVGHELRTPITIIRGNLELMNAGDAADVEEVKEIALDELDRLTGLVEELVTLAKADRPDFVTTAPIDVAALTYEVAEKIARTEDRPWTVDEAAQVVHDLDAARITQAWLQLVSNAVKYSDAGTEIAIGSRSTVVGSSGELSLWVRDRGIGIPPDEQQRIFERFGRGSNSTRAEGSGLGLNIVTEIVRAHGGTVSVRSTPGEGSTFTMDFAFDA